MQFKKFNPVTDKEDFKSFLDFQKITHTNPYLIQRAIDKCKMLIHLHPETDYFLVFNGSELVGRMALGSHPDIKDESGIPYAHAGMFDFIEDYNLFCQMMDFARAQFKNLRKMLYPFFSSTWHDYRMLVSKEFELFLDPLHPSYYPEYIDKYGYEHSESYQSHISSDLNTPFQRIVKHKEYFERNGNYVRDVNHDDIDNEMKIFHNIAIQSAMENNFYREINLQEFNFMFKNVVLSLPPQYLSFAFSKDNKPLGAFFSLPYFGNKEPDSPDFLSGKIQPEGFMAKSTILVKRAWRSGAYSALGYQHLKYFMGLGMKYAIAAYYHESNKASYAFPTDGVFNKYKLFIIKI